MLRNKFAGRRQINRRKGGERIASGAKASASFFPEPSRGWAGLWRIRHPRRGTRV